MKLFFTFSTQNTHNKLTWIEISLLIQESWAWKIQMKESSIAWAWACKQPVSSLIPWQQIDSASWLWKTRTSVSTLNPQDSTVVTPPNTMGRRADPRQLPRAKIPAEKSLFFGKKPELEGEITVRETLQIILPPHGLEFNLRDSYNLLGRNRSRTSNCATSSSWDRS